MSEAATVRWAARSAPVRELESVASTDSPSAPPTCWVVLTSPETRPESSGVAVDIASVISDGNAIPAPIPSAINGTSRSGK